MTDPSISVIIPTYNRAQYICGTVDSVLAQTYGNIKVIVIDDGSIDNTRDILRRYGSKIKYVFQNNAGPSAARNNGIRRSRGDLIAFLDSDDIWLPEKLGRQVQLIEESRDIGLVGCGRYHIDASDKVISGPLMGKNYQSKKVFLKELMVRNMVSGGVSGALIRRECFDKLGLFDESLWVGEDRDMWLRIAKHYEVRFVEEPLVKTRLHAAQLRANVARIETDGKKVVARNIERWRLITRRKAYSYIHTDLACEYTETGNRNLALINILKSIAIYPLKSYNGDNKYRLLCKSLLPPRLFSFLRRYTFYRRRYNVNQQAK